jgi:hypothetical protein
MKFYLDVDLRKNIYYLAPFIRTTEQAYVLEFSTRYEADNFLKKLNLGHVLPPDEDPSLYDNIGREELMGKILIIYRLKKR